ncbi:NAD(P)/FAD-dependent oxidoreductase [Xylophilus rhododendri]|uniref:NAD(P)/FAD-dependent oxidoreductase n=1 Tax=Xylophilus rhododendri TaxID=2697032 RepID=UPI001E51A3AF|nr:FAD-binding oxidoreductase [Xylophilus rhododendri]
MSGHLVVVGAGIVGLSCAWEAQRRGWAVSIVDRDFEGDRASHGNAGGIAVSECVPLSLAGLGLKPLRWLLDPLGPLSVRPAHAPRLLPWFLALRKVAEPARFQRIARALATINDISLPAFEDMLADIGLQGDIHKRGALTVYETAAAFAQDAAEWALKRSLGVRWREVSASEIRSLEPALAPAFAAGVMLEDWAHIDDPMRVVQRLRETLQARGAVLVRGEVAAISAQGPAQATAQLASGGKVTGQRLLVAAGAWSARLSQGVGDKALLESERGYNTTLPESASMLGREVIFAERKFVATPLSVGLRIGGAAEFAGLDSAPNYQRSDALLQLARRYLPDLQEAGARRWMGNRPATPDSLPVIGPRPPTRAFFMPSAMGIWD